jgi:hypothetical protein
MKLKIWARKCSVLSRTEELQYFTNCSQCDPSEFVTKFDAPVSLM